MSVRISSRVFAWVLAAAAAPMVTASPALAAPFPGWSWNLSRDMMAAPAQNPNGPWTYMASSTLALPFPSILPTHSASCYGSWLDCWNDTDGAMVGASTQTGTNSLPYTKGLPILHPGSGRHVAVRWRNPTAYPLDLQILGRVTDQDRFGGDGVSFSLVRQFGNVVLASGSVNSTTASTTLDSRTFYATTTVGANQDIYFIVNRGGHHIYDSTELDLLITATVNCAVTSPNPC